MPYMVNIKPSETGSMNTSKQNFYHDYFEKNSNNITLITSGKVLTKLLMLNPNPMIAQHALLIKMISSFLILMKYQIVSTTTF